MLKGIVGHIKWHYYTAAAINGYTVTWNRDRTAWALSATVVLSDAFKLSQRPLVFVAQYKDARNLVREWRFPVLEHSVTLYRLTARLGPPQEAVTS